MTSDDAAESRKSSGVRGRPADPFGSPPPEEQRQPDAPNREIPIGVPDPHERFDERKRAAKRPDPDSDASDAQIDYGDGGGSR